ncbi:sulfotransferase family protein [Oscillatoria sp. CS-180]|uniref:sulfotransferase family protein n=1 Tax=Oscillatoria sp. CS-180 TaxID=3021720 RepID=UPI00232DA97F|nr:sulfotransferase family protein [Oscillatoria sp. CS-180]MDB9525591.1 sulfotransferase family protein [Oscillatoria sp. CS-180]
MSQLTQSLRDRVRSWKNYSIQQYLSYRLYHHSDPYRIAFRQRPYRVLWMLSHMRSGSSLLTHILNTNPDIAGYGETHICYQSSEDFKKLLFKVYWQAKEYRNFSDLQDLALSETYILDKLLHNNKLTDLNLLDSSSMNCIFLIREPKRTLNSIRDLKPNWSEEETLYYYCKRLEGLVSYAEKIDSPARSLLIEHDQLINETTSVFEALKHFLGTEVGFSEEYQLLKTTGAKHVGDHRGNILSGQIVRTPRKLNETVSPASIEQAQVVYENCRDRLLQLTSSIFN